MKVVAFVPIKLNSQRLKNKNILPLSGKPLCSYIVETLLSVSGIDKVYVYCSDEDIKRYIPGGAEFLKRPERLDADNVKGYEIYSEFISTIEADVYILAHATSPFLKRESIENSLKMVTEGDYDSAFSAKKIQTFVWFKGKPLNYDLEDVPRTQDIEPVLVETSGFFIFKKHVFTELKRRIGNNPYICMMDNMEAVDIDEKDDYSLAVKIMGGEHNE